MNVEFMFIRFVSGEVHERSQVAAGLFCAASQLRWSDGLPDYEFDALAELRDWFNEHMDSPFDHLPLDAHYNNAVCWFKPSASEHLARAWELVAILVPCGGTNCSALLRFLSRRRAQGDLVIYVGGVVKRVPSFLVLSGFETRN